MLFKLVRPLCTEMGKGRHHIPNKKEFIKKYSHINKIKQVDYHSQFDKIHISFLSFFCISSYVLSLS